MRLNASGGKPSKSAPSVSACLIVKDRAPSLARCLASLADLAAEIILIDAGASEASLEIARRYGAKIYPYTWKHHFADARNYALDMASGDWILSIDPDDILPRETLERIPDYLARQEFKSQPCALNFRICSEAHDEIYSRGLFPTGFGIRFAGRVHEIPVLSRQALPAYQCRDLPLWHFAPAGQDGGQASYYRDLMELSLKEESDPQLINHIQKHLGLNYLAAQALDKAWLNLSACYEGMQTLRIRPWDSSYGEVLRGLVLAGSKLGKPSETRKYFSEYASFHPSKALEVQDEAIKPPGKALHRGLQVWSRGFLAARQRTASRASTQAPAPARLKPLPSFLPGEGYLKRS